MVTPGCQCPFVPADSRCDALQYEKRNVRIKGSQPTYITTSKKAVMPPKTIKMSEFGWRVSSVSESEGAVSAHSGLSSGVRLRGVTGAVGIVTGNNGPVVFPPSGVAVEVVVMVVAVVGAGVVGVAVAAGVMLADRSGMGGECRRTSVPYRIPNRTAETQAKKAGMSKGREEMLSVTMARVRWVEKMSEGNVSAERKVKMEGTTYKHPC